MRRVLVQVSPGLERADSALPLALAGCGPSGAEPAPSGAADAGFEASAAGADASSTGSDASSDPDPDPVITAAERVALEALSPPMLPAAPPDITNAFADSDAAANLGQELFYDPEFSGTLLDTDNDGSPESLGVAGQTGRVACAGCHILASGFSDTRSFQQQIPLGAGGAGGGPPRCSTSVRRASSCGTADTTRSITSPSGPSRASSR